MTHEEIVESLLECIYTMNPGAEQMRPLPLDKSLYDSGVIDSVGVVELVEFIEQNWQIKILDSEITQERFGGVNKMATVVAEKLAEKGAAS
jgi:acyl carrier protein